VALTRLWAGNLGGLIGSVALVCWPLPGGLLDLIVEKARAMDAYRLGWCVTG
jgi:hypothetical protein